MEMKEYDHFHLHDRLVCPISLEVEGASFSPCLLTLSTKETARFTYIWLFLAIAFGLV